MQVSESLTSNLQDVLTKPEPATNNHSTLLRLHDRRADEQVSVHGVRELLHVQLGEVLRVQNVGIGR